MYHPSNMELGSSSLVLPSSRELLNKEVWSEAEDLLLTRYIEEHGPGNWGQVPPRAGLNQCPESCRLRWFNVLQPNVKRGEFEPDEEDLIIRMHKLFGNRWSLIAGRFPGRTADDIKNYYNTHLSMEKSYFECKLPLPNIRSIEINHSVTSTIVFRPVPRRIPEFKAEEKDHEYSSSSTANNNNTVSGFRNTTNFHGMEHQKNNGSSTDNYFWNFDADHEVEDSAAKASAGRMTCT